MARRPIRVRQQKSALKRLEKLGLYKPKTDHVTDYGKKQISKYRDVLEGRATVVTAKRTFYPASNIKTRKREKVEVSARKQARAFRNILTVKGEKVVVPVAPKERPVFTKQGYITRGIKHEGKTVRGVIEPIRISNADDLRRLDSKGMYFALPLGRRGAFQNYEDVDELISDITRYYHNEKLARYVVLVPIPRDGEIPSSEPEAYGSAVQ